MPDKIRKDIKKAAKDAETKLTEAILRWKYNAEGSEIPDKMIIEQRSRVITDQANRILARGARNLWGGIKEIYNKKQTGKGEKN